MAHDSLEQVRDGMFMPHSTRTVGALPGESGVWIVYIIIKINGIVVGVSLVRWQ